MRWGWIGIPEDRIEAPHCERLLPATTLGYLLTNANGLHVEDNFFGKLPHLEPSAERSEELMLRDPKTGETVISAWEVSASGLVERD